MSSYQYSAAAHADIEKIATYLIEVNPAAAKRFLDSLEATCELLSTHPFIGQNRSMLGEGLRSYPVGNYLIFYIPMADGIAVARVIYGGRDLPGVF